MNRSSLKKLRKWVSENSPIILGIIAALILAFLGGTGCGGSNPVATDDGGAVLAADGGQNWQNDGGNTTDDDGGLRQDGGDSTDGGLTQDGGQIDGSVCQPQNCDDHINCTIDTWNQTTCTCERKKNHPKCPPHQICNPDDLEHCPGGCCAPPVCSNINQCPNPDPCLVVGCDAITATCTYTPLDRDNDGHSPRICESVDGDDCNDNDPNIHPGATEICNNKDDNCDGNIDENVTQECATACGPGMKTCVNGQWGACVVNIPEICDGIDNNCDGQTDENFSNKGNSCTVGVGACKRTGQYVCKVDHTGTECDVQPGQPSQEICDEIDNDCDGTVDNNSANECNCCDGIDNDNDGFTDINDPDCQQKHNYWCPTSIVNAPEKRYGHTAVWTGTEMIIWGGVREEHHEYPLPLNTGGRYNPTTNQWTPTTTNNAPQGRCKHSAVWRNGKMIIWGGGRSYFADGGEHWIPNYTGGIYNPTTNQWTPVSNVNAPSGEFTCAACWTTTKMIVWGKWITTHLIDPTGNVYNPEANQWTPMSTDNAPEGRLNFAVVSIGTKLIFWGGISNNNNPVNTGGIYNPETNQWTPTSIIDAPEGRHLHSAIWTGQKMIIWGGRDNAQADLNTGGIYNPDTDQWQSITLTNAPATRHDYISTWTGTEMIVWGGVEEHYGVINTGALYNPETHQWRPTSTINAPRVDPFDNTIWTGTEMIVWQNKYSHVKGGKYNPAMDQWIIIPDSNAPEGVSAYTNIWTGREMIVWGGDTSFSDICVNTGSKYYP